MAITINWTKSWSSSDNGTIFYGSDLGNIQGDIQGAFSDASTLSGNNTWTGTQIFSGAVTFTSTATGLSVVPLNYRCDLPIRYASTTTLTVGTGVLEINNTRVSKTSVTTLTISSAGDWAGGSSLRATSTVGYIGVDSSGNIKMHTTAPTNSDYALSLTAGMKRYASWSGTVYRVIGWFRMNATGSGELSEYSVSSFTEGNVRNSITQIITAVSTAATVIPDDDSIPQSGEGVELFNMYWVPSHPNAVARFRSTVLVSTDATATTLGALFADSATDATYAVYGSNQSTNEKGIIQFEAVKTMTSTTPINYKYRVGPGSTANLYVNGNGSSGARRLGGVAATFFTIDEIF